MQLIYAVARTTWSTIVTEANWKPIDVPQLRALRRPLVQVHCNAPAPVLRERVLHRIKTGERHAVHRDGTDPAVLEEALRGIAAEESRLLDLGAPVLPVDTSGPVDGETVAVWIRERLADLAAS